MAEVTPHAPPRARPLRTVLTAALILAALGVLVSLGNWQVRRLAWKEGLLADIASRRVMAPVGVGDIEKMVAAGQDIEYRPVTVVGTFDHAHEQFFFSTFHGATGYDVYTPLMLADGKALFVNRGFVPYDDKDPATRAAGEVKGVVTVTGLARGKLAGKPSSFVPENEPAKNIFFWKDLDAMTAHAGLDPGKVLPFFVDANDAPNPGGLPAGGVTEIDLPNNHLQYAITWYGLAVALCGIVAAYWLRGRRKAFATRDPQ